MRPIYRGFAPSRTDESLSTLPFSWESDDGSIDALSGQVGTFARTSGGGLAADGLGLMRTLPRGMPRFEGILDPISGQRRLGLRIEPARTNLVTYTDDLTQWTEGGTCPVVATMAVGDLVLGLLDDNDSGNPEWRRQTITFTGNGVKSWTVAIKQDTASSSRISIYDDTAAAQRADAYVTWASGLPVVNLQAGVYLGYTALADGVFLLHFQTTSVTATNTHHLYLRPATAIGGNLTGRTWFGGGAAYNNVIPQGLIRSGASGESVNAESLSWPLALPRAGRRWWGYLGFWDVGAFAAASQGLAVVGSVANCGMGFYRSGSAGYGAFHYADGTGDSAVAVPLGLPTTVGAYVEILVTTDALGRPTVTTAITTALGGVQIGTAASANAPANLTEDWTDQLVRLGAWSTTPPHGGALYHRLKFGEIGYLGTPALERVRGYR